MNSTNQLPFFRLFLLFILFLICYNTSDAQDYSGDLVSPRASYKFFHKQFKDNNYSPEHAGKIFEIYNDSPENAKKSAIRLKQVIDGQGIQIDVYDLPNKIDYYDSTRNEHEYAFLQGHPEIYLKRINNKWLIPKECLNDINLLHEYTYPFGVDKLLNILPKLGHKSFFGLQTWQWITLLCLILISVITYVVFTFLFQKLFYRLLKDWGYATIAARNVYPVAKPFSIMVILIVLKVFFPVMQLPASVTYYILLMLKAGIPLFAILVAYHFVDVLSFYFKKQAVKTESTLDDQLIPLVRKALKTIVVVIGVLFALSNLNINITALITGLSIGGLAFALAAQDTIKNFFGSIMIFVDRPFQIGDWVTSGEIDGTVEEVGFRSTRVRTFRDSVTYVPNGKLADAVVDNHGLRYYRRFYTDITIAYDTPSELIETFIEGLKKIVDDHPNTRKDFYNIYLNTFGSHSLNIMFYIFFQLPSWQEELSAREEVILQIIRLAEHLGIRFAFPTQTLHVENFPGQESLSPKYDRDKSNLNNKLNGFFKGRGSAS